MIMNLLEWIGQKARNAWCYTWGHDFYSNSSAGLKCRCCGARWPAD